MKSIIICIILSALSINGLAQESQVDQNYQKGEELFGKKEYKEIDAYCRKKGIIWFASFWIKQIKLGWIIRKKTKKLCFFLVLSRESSKFVAEYRNVATLGAYHLPKRITFRKDLSNET